MIGQGGGMRTHHLSDIIGLGTTRHAGQTQRHDSR